MKLSHSSVSLLGECPLKWKFKYVDRLPEKPKHYFSLGKSVHSALEFMYAGDACPDEDAILGKLADEWLSEGYKDAAQESKSRREAQAMLRAYHAAHAPTWRKPLKTEFKFEFSIDHVPVIGYIDRVDVDPASGLLTVLDYKTGRMWDMGRALKDKQLTLYQMAVEALDLGTVDRLELHHVPSLAVDGSPAHGEELVAELRAEFIGAAARIGTGDFPPTPSEEACRWCDHKALCPQWRGLAV